MWNVQHLGHNSFGALLSQLYKYSKQQQAPNHHTPNCKPNAYNDDDDEDDVCDHGDGTYGSIFIMFNKI